MIIYWTYFFISASVMVEAHVQDPPPHPLIGTWDVALYFSEEAPPSATIMEIESVVEGVPVGTFYGSAFEEARVITRDNMIIFTMTTSDNSGAYIHSGRLIDGEMDGQTLSVGRDFLMPWTAEVRTD